MKPFENFGKNIRFEPTAYHEPSSEKELLSLLSKNVGKEVRVIGSRHSWSPLIASSSLALSLKHFNDVNIHWTEEGPIARLGGGCQIKHVLTELSKHGLTLPAVGLITEQTIAGAAATGTHGSGRHCISHYIKSLRIACFRDRPSEPTIVKVDQGEALRAAKCSLGCLGVVVEVEVPCVPQYRVEEGAMLVDSIEEVLQCEDQTPLQQSYLFPHYWRYGVHARRRTDRPKTLTAELYRFYMWLGIDVLFHLLVKAVVNGLRSRALTRFFYRHIMPWFVLTHWKVIDRSDRVLTMEHELFRHLELEAFVPRRHLAPAMQLVESLLKHADGQHEASITAVESLLRQAGLWDDYQAIRGIYTHHYPICIRRVVPDDTLISMTSGGDEDWYAISFITYAKSREPFFQVAELIAKALLHRFDGRIHWGKWFPLQQDDVETMYPEIERFREACRELDPHGMFQNDFTRRVIDVAHQPGE